MRVATIDIGTNTVLLLVAEQQGFGALTAIAERSAITRLGEGVDRTRTLLPAAVQRTREALLSFAAEARTLGAERVGVVGTSAMRDASGGEQIRSCVRDAFGVEARVLGGEEEARLTFRGALSGLAHREGEGEHEEVAVFDIGGGSTEVVVGRAEGTPNSLSYVKSFDIGSVRLTERHVSSDPPSPADLEALANAAREAFLEVPQIGGTRSPVGIAGTVTTLAAVILGIEPYDGARLHGRSIEREKVRNVVRSLASMNVKSRSQVPGMEPKRADVIIAGGAIVLALLDHWNVSEMTVSDRGVRWGLAEELLLTP